MSLTLDEGRQPLSVAKVAFGFADFGENGVAEKAVELPAGAIVTGGFIDITEVFNSTTSDAIDVGDTATPARYKAAVDAQALGLTALVPTGDTSAADVTLELTAGTFDTATTGAGLLVIEYIIDGRADYHQR